MLPLFQLRTQGLQFGDHDSEEGDREVAGRKGLNSKCSLETAVQIPGARLQSCPQLDLHDELVAQHNVGKDNVRSSHTPLLATPLLEVSSSCAAARIQMFLEGHCIVRHGSRANTVVHELTKNIEKCSALRNADSHSATNWCLNTNGVVLDVHQCV